VVTAAPDGIPEIIHFNESSWVIEAPLAVPFTEMLTAACSGFIQNNKIRKIENIVIHFIKASV
jgi:hypothetical protein